MIYTVLQAITYRYLRFTFNLQGKIILDGEEIDQSLIDMVASTQQTSNNNNVIKFGDNSR